jgi:hypothetical protein
VYEKSNTIFFVRHEDSGTELMPCLADWVWIYGLRRFVDYAWLSRDDFINKDLFDLFDLEDDDKIVYPINEKYSVVVEKYLNERD